MVTLHGRTGAVLAGVTVSFIFAAGASAQYPVIVVQGIPPANLRIERVAYGDLNLATRAGEHALQLRVGHAVERVCLYDKHRSYRGTEPRYDQCVAGSWARARPQMAGAISRARQFAAAYRY